MELREYIAVGRRWLWLFVLATAVAAVGAWVATRFSPRTYRSQTTLMVGRATDNPDPNFQALYMSQQLASTYAQMATREPVLQGVVDALGLKTSWHALHGMVKADPVPGSPLFTIAVVDTDPVRAQVIGDAVAQQLIEQSPTPSQRKKMEDQVFIQSQLDQLRSNIDAGEQQLKEIESQIGLETSARAIADLQNRNTALQSKLEAWSQRYADLRTAFEGSDVNSLAVIEPATPGAQVGPNVRMNVLLAIALGFGLALGAVLLLEYLNDTVKTTENIEKRLGLTGLATIERVENIENRRDGLVTLNEPRSPIAEAYRALRTNLQFSLLGHSGGALLITSANPGEGKSTTAANLAVVMAQGGKSVILVDSDLRRPSLHRFYGFTNSLGVTSLLLDESLGPDDALRQVENVPNLRVLTSGPLPPNPAEVLESSQMRTLLERLRGRADIVLLDSPPLLVVTDGAILSTIADATLLVLDSGDTRIEAARKAAETLEKVGVQPIGAVVNKLDRDSVGGYYYYYYNAYRYRYGEYYGGSNGEGGHGGSQGGGTGAAPTAPGRSRPTPQRLLERVMQSFTSLLS